MLSRAGESPNQRPAALLVVSISIALALVSARPYAGSWSDASQLALAQSLVDYRSAAIGRSMFVGGGDPALTPPYRDAALQRSGTMDKLFIGGRYYSAKPPVPSVIMAGLYQLLRWSTGLQARRHPGWFCYLMTAGLCGAAYVTAVWCVFQLGGAIGLTLAWQLALAFSIGFATIALPYSRQVNSHIVLLAVAAAIALNLARLAKEAGGPGVGPMRVLGLGTLAGFGYTMDLGAGAVLLLTTSALVIYRAPRLRCVALFMLAALPWLALHHGINYAISGMIAPANTAAANFRWPGSPFDAANMTGVWRERGPAGTAVYGLALLFGKRGFIGHDLPLFLALPAIMIALGRRREERAELIWAGCFAGGTWLLYVLLSGNYSGGCCSVRWFVPLLAPAYYVLAVFLRDNPRYRPDFLILTGWGAVLGAVMWWQGPWLAHTVPLFWPVQAAALTSWAAWRLHDRRAARADAPVPA